MANEKLTQNPGGSSPESGSASQEFPCPDCGEMVREGLVRCWNCGGFLRPELEKEFRKMRARPRKIIYSPVTEEEQNLQIDQMMAGAAPGAPAADTDDDFQLTSAVSPQAPGAAPSAGAATPSSTTAVQAGQSPPPSPSAPENSPTAATGTSPLTSEPPHSQSTGGDFLMQLAAQEETERLKRQIERGTSIDGVRQIQDGFLIDAPKGCRIQIRDERTGELRRLTFASSSRVRISLLDKVEALARERAQLSKQDTGPKHLSAGKFERWMSDVHLHTLNPEKLKIKADSLVKEFVAVELGFAADSLFTATLPAGKKGLFGAAKGGDEAKDPRTALLEHFRAGKAPEHAPAGEKWSCSSDKLAEMRVVQPAASLAESLFPGIPVFGTGRIAVQLPITKAGDQPRILSFTLSEFRTFVEIIGSLYAMANFGRNLGIPLADSFSDEKCHYSSANVRALQHVEYYQADPALGTVLAGWKCEACGIVISEAAREKEKLGGKGAKAIAKTPCPKCKQKFGSHPLYTLVSVAQGPSMTDDQPGGGTAKLAESAPLVTADASRDASAASGLSGSASSAVPPPAPPGKSG